MTGSGAIRLQAQRKKIVRRVAQVSLNLGVPHVSRVLRRGFWRTAGGPPNAWVPHSIALFAIEWVEHTVGTERVSKQKPRSPERGLRLY